MPPYRYRDRLWQKLKPGEDPLDKLPLLYADLGVAPPPKYYDPKPILALAERHVRGFQGGGKAGRRSKLAPYVERITEEYGQVLGSVAEEGARANLRYLVSHFRKTWRTAGGRPLTQLQIVTRLSKMPPTEGLEPYHGIEPKTLLSWLSHSGPRSEFQKERKRKLVRAGNALCAYLKEGKLKA
jgi:hypothetical protein